jgi:hypothetical protein
LPFVHQLYGIEISIMSDPTPQQVDWYIKWWNALPARTAAVEPWDGKPWRRKCPVCDIPMVAKKNAEGEVFMDMEHKSDCKLHLEFLLFEKANPNLSPGNLWLEWNHRHDD